MNLQNLKGVGSKTIEALYQANIYNLNLKKNRYKNLFFLFIL